MRGVGELDVGERRRGATTRIEPAPYDVTCPYLLLDIRDRDEYDQCHIIPALSYSKAYLSRATNYESKEMLQFKNREGKIIVLYDEDEKIAPIAASTLVQRGYDNVFLLSGGLKVASKLFPHGLISGTLPISITGSKPRNIQPASQNCFTNDDVNKIEIYLDNVLQDSDRGSRMSSSSSKASVASSRQGGSASSRASLVSTDRPAFRP
jgi:centrosomal protein CEP41